MIIYSQLRKKVFIHGVEFPVVCGFWAYAQGSPNNAEITSIEPEFCETTNELEKCVKEYVLFNRPTLSPDKQSILIARMVFRLERIAQTRYVFNLISEEEFENAALKYIAANPDDTDHVL